jgi:uncharacterized protein with FMN-binding domain
VKRILLTLLATVTGIVALLSFKTHGGVTAGTAGLPSAGLPTSAATSGGPPAASTTTGAPPDPSSAPNGSQTAPASAASSASYTGSEVTTRYGIVQVKIALTGKKITNVSFVQLTAFDGRSQRINAGAAPILLQETLSAQSAQIDSVSGASYTSEGYDQSLQSALDEAGI